MKGLVKEEYLLPVLTSWKKRKGRNEKSLGLGPFSGNREKLKKTMWIRSWKNKKTRARRGKG